MKSNPFATAHTSPGKIPWHPQDGRDLELIAEQFLANSSRLAAIVGPHGTGKTTLLHHLQPLLGELALKRTGSGETIENAKTGNIVWLQLRRDCEPWNQVLNTKPLWHADGILILDGFEQLSLIQRLLVVRKVVANEMKLLATAHRAQWLIPTIYRTQISNDLAHTLTVKLLAQCDPNMNPAELADRGLLTTLLEANQGNLREVFMQLFDRYRDAQKRMSKN